MFGLPLVTAYGAPPFPGEVVGADPWEDADDATYASGSAAADFHHIEATIAPSTVEGDPGFVFRVSATKQFAGGMARFVANLYPPGWTSAGQAGGDTITPPLNFTAGANATYVEVAVADGTPQHIPVTILDWNTEAPATTAQIVAYFAAGGTLLIQPSTFGAGAVKVTVHRISGSVAPTPPITHRRVFPRDDGLGGGSPRTFPPSKSAQSGNRTTGGYL